MVPGLVPGHMVASAVEIEPGVTGHAALTLGTILPMKTISNNKRFTSTLFVFYAV